MKAGGRGFEPRRMHMAFLLSTWMLVVVMERCFLRGEAAGMEAYIRPDGAIALAIQRAGS